MPFGLYNAPAIFQALIEKMMEDFEFVAGLLNNITVWGNILNQLYKCVRLVLRKITEYSIILNVRKFVMFVIKEVFLKFVILAAGITADEDKVAAIRDRPKPSTTTEIRAFVNAAGYFRHLIEKYSTFSGPLTDLTGGPKGQPLKLEPLAKAAWKKIREAITTLPIIKSFEWTFPVIIKSDSSQKHVGEALLQPHMVGTQRVLHPVAYFSKKLTDTQTRYSSQKREFLAIIICLQHWRHWVKDGDVTVIIDHESLKTLNTKTELPARIMRFLDAMENFGARIIYRPGTANVLADYLSRPPDTAHAADERKRARITRPKELNRIDLQAIHKHLSYNEPLPPILESKWVKKHFVVYNNHLHRISQHNKDPDDPSHPGGLTTKAAVLLRVPETGELHQEARNAHYALGHGSIGAMQRKLDTALWHPKLVLAVQQTVAKCPQYQLMKKPNITLSNLVPIKPPSLLTRWAIDYTFWEESSILIMVEYATKWVKASFVPSKH
jgi:hypothetical protein